MPAWVIAVLGLAPGPIVVSAHATAPVTIASEPDPDDEASLERAAQDAFAAGRYDDTVRYAARAFELTGDYRHLYAQAHAERFRGNCSAALGLYARVMAAERDGELGELARQGIQRCGDAAPEPVAPPEPAATPATMGVEPRVEPAPQAEPVEAPAPDRDRKRAPAWIRDPLGGVLLATGLGSTAAGAGLWVQSSAQLRTAERAGDEGTFADGRDRARGLRIGAIVAWSAGGAIVTGAIVRYAVVARRDRRTRVSFGPLPRGAALAIHGSF